MFKKISLSTPIDLAIYKRNAGLPIYNSGINLTDYTFYVTLFLITTRRLKNPVLIKYLFATIFVIELVNKSVPTH